MDRSSIGSGRGGGLGRERDVWVLDDREQSDAVRQSEHGGVDAVAHVSDRSVRNGGHLHGPPSWCRRPPYAGT
jgi:hypothetical protein